MHKDELIRRVLDEECTAEEEKYHAELLQSDSDYRVYFEKLQSLKDDLRMIGGPCLETSVKDSIMEGVMEIRAQQSRPAAIAASDDACDACADRFDGAVGGSRQPAQPALERLGRPRWLYISGLAASCGLGLIIGFFLALHAGYSQEPKRTHSDSLQKTVYSAANTPEQKEHVDVAGDAEDARIQTANGKENGLEKVPGDETTLVRFVVHAPGAENVMLVGDFNNWSKEAATMIDPEGNGIWRLTIPLKSGTHRYKFLVDGEKWVNDPGADSRINDGFGGFNSLIRL